VSQQSVVGHVLADLINVYLLLLVVRAIMDTVLSFKRDLHPTGAGAAALEVVYTATDPPLKALRRLIPPLRIGNAAIDVGFIVLFVGLVIIRNYVFSQL